MKYLAAYALLALSGNNNVTAADIKRVLGDAQINADDADINRLIESVKGKPIHQLIAEGTKQIGTAAPSAPAATTTAKVTEAPKKEAKKEAPKKEAPPAEEEDDFMAGGLFD